MAWRRPGDKPLSEPMTVKLLTHICVTRPQLVNSFVRGWCRCNFNFQTHFELMAWCRQVPVMLYSRWFVAFSANCRLLLPQWLSPVPLNMRVSHMYGFCTETEICHLIKFSSLIAQKVIKLTIFGAASGDYFFKITTFRFQCKYSEPTVFFYVVNALYNHDIFPFSA